MKITKRQLKLVIENYLRGPELIFEIKKKAFNHFIQKGQITQSDFNRYVFDKDWVYPFNDPIMGKILFNTLSANQGHSLGDISQGGEEILNKIVSNARRGDLPPRAMRGTGGQMIDILPKIDVSQPDNTTLTYDEAMQYIESGSGVGKRSDILNRVITDGINGRTSEFEVVAMPSSGNPYFVAYPKTYKGSIALGRMGPNYEYLNPNSPEEKAQLGEMSWCTTIDGAGNMFLNYHQKMNLHMYYLTRVNDYDPNAPERKFCLSFIKKGDYVALKDGSHATVDGNNQPISKESVINIIGQRLFSLIENDVKNNPERKEINPKEYYKSISLEQYQAMREAHQSENDIALFVQEAREIAVHTQNEDIIIEMIKDPHKRIRGVGIRFGKTARATQAAIQTGDIDELIKSYNLPLPSGLITDLYHYEKQSSGGKASGFYMWNMLRSNSAVRPISPELFSEMVDDVVNDNYTYATDYHSRDPQRAILLHSIVKKKDMLNPESITKLYEKFSNDRYTDRTGRNIPNLIAHPECPKEIVDEAISDNFIMTPTNSSGDLETSTNGAGESISEVSYAANSLIRLSDNSFFQSLSKESFDTLIDTLAYVAKGHFFMSNLKLDPVYMIKTYERGIHREVLFNSNNYENKQGIKTLSFRTEPSLFAPTILKLQKDRLHGETNTENLTEQQSKTERLALYVSLFVHPTIVSDMSEYFSDEYMEIGQLLEEDIHGGTESNFAKLFDKSYGKPVNIDNYLSEIIAYMQTYEDEPEDGEDSYNEWILTLYNMASYVLKGKATWQSYSQQNGVPWPNKFNKFLEY